MAKLRREEIIAAALDLLDEVGLDALSTRALAQRLGVESASLYWHFRDKAALLDEMASSALAEHQRMSPPSPGEPWHPWFLENARAFRRALLSRRDGARLHAGTVPGPAELVRLAPKIAHLERAGFTKAEALLALFTASQFTLGSVLEEQVAGSALAMAPGAPDLATALAAEVASVASTREEAFEFGLGLIADGLRSTRRRRRERA